MGSRDSLCLHYSHLSGYSLFYGGGGGGTLLATFLHEGKMQQPSQPLCVVGDKVK